MNLRHLIRLMLPVLPAAIAIACGGANDNLPPPPPPPPPPPVEATPAPVDAGPAAPAPTAEAPPAPPAAPPTLTEGTASPDPDKPTPTVSFLAPTKEQVIPAAKVADFEVKLDVKNWKTAPGDAHVHLILDNKPYKPIFDPKAKVTLGDLFGSDTPGVGQHVLVAFPSRANHESVKTKGSLSIIEFWIDAKGKKDSDKLQDITKPTLIYSRPKGEYKGDMANHILVDFQLANVTLAPDKNHVHIAITGPGIDGEKTADVTKFGAPYYLDNPAAGSYDVKVDLLGADGKVLPGNWNSTARTITVAK
ncbi:MAG TPA: hypothetical protein VK841_08180 [Polyangiaceae bacterium]|jgi:hypothetical protein|nr:hypothetical protein [Polyangiaceae bacterium]